MSDYARRGFWLGMVLLFVVTGLGVGVYAFWANTHPNSNTIACSSGPKTPNQQPVNGKIRGTHLADFTPLKNKHISYLTCVDFKKGSGPSVTSANQTVTVKYVGALASNGEIFDDSFDNGQDFMTQLTQVVQGWGDGLQGMKVGGIRRLLIPSQYAYGSQAVSTIPANSDLVFDIQLVAVK